MRTSLSALVLVFAATAASAAPPEAPARQLTGLDLFNLQVATDPQIRPDGAVVAYTRVSYDVMTDSARPSIWLIDVATGQQTPLVTGSGSHSTPRWAPAGKRLAYVSTADEGRPQLFVRWLEVGQTTRLAELVEAPGALAWSNDGGSIAFTMFAPDEGAKLGEAPPKPEGAEWAKPLEVITDITYRTDEGGYLKAGYTHVYVVAADGGAPRQLTFGAYNEAGPLAWSADGRFVYAVGNRTPNWRREPVDTELYRITLADGSVTAITSRVGPDAAPDVSPDGTKIAYLGYDDELLGFENGLVYVADPDGRNSRALTTALDRNVDAVAWADNRTLVIKYDDLGSAKLARLDLTGRIEPLAEGLTGAGLDRPYTGGEFSVASNGNVAFTSGTAQRPADVAAVVRGRRVQLTHLNDAFLGGKSLGAVRSLPVTSSFDGRPVGAWLVTPPDFEAGKKYPLILEIHGGPYAAYGPTFATDMQLYASAGYVVLYTNPRGSTSYGEEFANLIQHNYPSQDYDDLMSAVDAAIATGYVDADKLYVTGGSGGGILTAWIVGKTNRFKAAAAQKPVINWASTVLTTDVATYMPKYWFAKPPWEDPDSYWSRSPLSLVGSVTTPTLVVVGDRDFRTPVSDSEQYYQALQLKGVPTALVKVPDASHGGLAARPSQSASRVSAILAWFGQHTAAH
ncbi:MAG TPA: S9 family peptidase [Gammaproteobacteria bacterium]|nr:S9 family peptidase [Gammaproteobacteria bacterium]